MLSGTAVEDFFGLAGGSGGGGMPSAMSFGLAGGSGGGGMPSAMRAGAGGFALPAHWCLRLFIGVENTSPHSAHETGMSL